VRRDDARPFALASPRVAAPAVAAVGLPLVVWGLLVGVWLGVALAAVAGVAAWTVVRLAGEVHSQALELDRLRSVDALTGLPNRRVWDDALPRELARSVRAGTPLAVAILAVDGFESYEDQHGRQAGDLLLKELAALWPSELRDSDLLARYGLHEFGLLLPDCGVADVRAVVDKVRSATPSGVTCSAGVATWDGLEDACALVRRADAALVSAAREGSGSTVLSPGAARPEPAGA
jgi:diguanylate cyclase